MAFIRKFKTGSGATGVQVCWKEQGKVVRTIHVGSASSDVALEKLLKKARKVLRDEENQGQLPLFNLEKFSK